MTRKDYDLIASVLRDYLLGNALNPPKTPDDKTLEGFSIAVDAIATSLKLDNDRFNEDRFKTAIVEGKGL